MDIYCPHCAEPWDWHELRELAAEVSDRTAESFEQALCHEVKSFARLGCGLWGQCADGVRRGMLRNPELMAEDYTNEALEWIELLGAGGPRFDLDAAISGWPRPRDC